MRITLPDGSTREVATIVNVPGAGVRNVAIDFADGGGIFIEGRDAAGKDFPAALSDALLADEKGWGE